LAPWALAGDDDGARRSARFREEYGRPRRIGASRISPHRVVFELRR
jgi:hypothetical protein